MKKIWGDPSPIGVWHLYAECGYPITDRGPLLQSHYPNLDRALTAFSLPPDLVNSADDGFQSESLEWVGIGYFTFSSMNQPVYDAGKNQ